jgi:allantoinase
MFSNKVELIISHLKKKIIWNQISTSEKWRQFKTEIAASNSPATSKIFDGNFLLLIPGAIDPHVHFNTPGFESREDFEHGSLAAAYGGVTVVIDMPCTSIPPVTSSDNLKTKMKAIDGRSWVDYAFWGGVSGNDFKMFDERYMFRQIYDLVQMGVVGFKAYIISGMPSFESLNFEDMFELALMIRSIGVRLAVHAEDNALVLERQHAFQKKGLNTWRDYCQARDDIAEAKAVTSLIEIARKTECAIHIVHLSSKLALEQIVKAQQEGLLVSAETCPHYLYFTEAHFQNQAISNYLKTAPPVKNEADRDALWQGLQDGTIAFIATDHAGCDPVKEKSSWNFWEVYGGIPGVEHRVPFLFSEGFKKGRLTLSQTINLLATNIADFFSLSPQKGRIATGADADFALINLWDRQMIRSENMHSKGKYTPFEGVTIDAVVEATYLRGKMVINRTGEIESMQGYGKPLLLNQ